MELSDVFDCKKGIIKQMKIVKMAGELSPTTILHICRHLVKKLIFCIFANRPTSNLSFLEGNLLVLTKKERFCKIFYEMKFRLHVYTYLRVKNDLKNKNSCHIHFTLFGTKVPLVLKAGRRNRR